MRPKFIYESLTDLFKPKSKEDIDFYLSKLSQDELNDKLHDASIYGLTSVIQYLIDAGADVNTKDKWGQTPLINASANGYKDIVNILIDNGANVNIKNINNWTALTWATFNGRKDIVKLLKKYSAI